MFEAVAALVFTERPWLRGLIISASAPNDEERNPSSSEIRSDRNKTAEEMGRAK